MKKLLILLFSISFAGTALAESQEDRQLKAAGVIDDDYVYIDRDLATKTFAKATDNLAKTLPIKLNHSIEITSFMMNSYYSHTTYRFTSPLNTEDRAQMSRDLASAKNLNEMCKETFIANEFMKANNMTLVYSYVDIGYKPLVKITMNNKVCNKAIAQ